MNITFDTSSTKLKKQFKFLPTEDIQLPPCSDNLKAMVIASMNLGEGGNTFTLEEIAIKAEALVGEWKTQDDVGPDYNAIGYTHRPKLLKMGIIGEVVEETNESE